MANIPVSSVAVIGDHSSVDFRLLFPDDASLRVSASIRLPNRSHSDYSPSFHSLHALDESSLIFATRRRPKDPTPTSDILLVDVAHRSVDCRFPDVFPGGSIGGILPICTSDSYHQADGIWEYDLIASYCSTERSTGGLTQSIQIHRMGDGLKLIGKNEEWFVQSDIPVRSHQPVPMWMHHPPPPVNQPSSSVISVTSIEHTGGLNWLLCGFNNGTVQAVDLEKGVGLGEIISGYSGGIDVVRCGKDQERIQDLLVTCSNTSMHLWDLRMKNVEGSRPSLRQRGLMRHAPLVAESSSALSISEGMDGNRTTGVSKKFDEIYFVGDKNSFVACAGQACALYDMRMLAERNLSSSLAPRRRRAMMNVVSSFARYPVHSRNTTTRAITRVGELSFVTGCAQFDGGGGVSISKWNFLTGEVTSKAWENVENVRGVAFLGGEIEEDQQQPGKKGLQSWWRLPRRSAFEEITERLSFVTDGAGAALCVSAMRQVALVNSVLLVSRALVFMSEDWEKK